MRILISLLTILIAAIPAGAVKFKFAANSVDPSSPKEVMEANVNALLNEIQSAGEEGRDLTLDNIDIEAGAAERLKMLWSTVHFTCDKNVNIAKCLYDVQGVQVRGIFITMLPVDSTYTQSLNRELTISLGKKGQITGVRPAMEIQEDVAKLMAEGQAVTDLRQRRELLKFVEDFRCYYNERNLDALEKIFSDNALIITGSVITKGRKSPDMVGGETTRAKYKVQSKTEYLDNLARVFKNNARLEVSFDKISVVENAAKDGGFYGVTLHQTWKSSSYSDEGWLFLYWDLTDPEQPKIMVRTWQEDQVVEEHGVFNMSDFFIP